MELKDLLAAQSAETKVEWGDSIIMVRFDPTAYTPKMEADAVKESNGPNSSMAVAHMVEKLVTDWDITEGGKPFPPTVENLATFPISLLTTILKAVATELKPGPLPEENSDEQS